MSHEVKQDPQTGTVAQKTVFDGPRAWLVYRLDRKSHYVSAEDIAEWDDLVKA